MRQLMTIGYEGSSIEDFIATLKQAEVTLLLDVREIPISRRKGFSKKALAQHAEAAGIEYRHERDLGSPRHIRHQLHTDGDYAIYFKSFTDYLKSQKPLLKKLASDLDGAVVLVCYERDPTTCHRSVVARQLENLTGLKVKHLGVRDGAGRQRAGARTCEGVPAA
ncbi:DUF488 family protein [Ottowia sp.]|uniref:DUF488 domain-containing protein n=1 Tax=Ottowia sp. TaxID=1898956 RepID=UPI0025E8CE23|nr:DUF488 domain-containing protein [Ottowia sp.]